MRTATQRRAASDRREPRHQRYWSSVHARVVELQRKLRPPEQEPGAVKPVQPPADDPAPERGLSC